MFVCYVFEMLGETEALVSKSHFLSMMFCFVVLCWKAQLKHGVRSAVCAAAKDA